MHRGYGVSAMIAQEFVAPLAGAAENSGYQTFWVNDVDGGNGLEQLARAQAATSTIRLGVGVLPVDRWTAALVSETVSRLGLDRDRLLIGIGAGAMHNGSLDAVRSFAIALKAAAFPHVLIGALGPKMCALAGEVADGVLLNWVTPSAADALSALTRTASQSRGATAEIISYVRTASDSAAESRLQRECAAYESYPSYKRHFDRMGARAIDTAVLGSAVSITAAVDAFVGITDEVVLRAIAADDSLAAYVNVMQAATPGSTR